MELHELSPFPVSIDWEGQEVTLKPFDLRAMTWAERFFSLENQSGYERMNKTLKNEFGEPAQQNAVVEIVHYLACGGFGISAKELKDKVREHKNSVEIFNSFVAALAEIFKTSNPAKEAPEPELTGGAIFEFFKAQEAEKGPQPKINWAQIYTKIYKSGGMTIDQFYTLTPRQVFAITEELGYLSAEDFRDMAIANGIPAKKIKIPKRREKQLLN